MRYLWVVFICLFVACWLGGCGGGNSVVPGDDQVTPQADKAPATTQYMPLKTGNVWKYKSPSVGDDTSRITGTVLVSNRTWFHERYVAGSGSTAEGEYRHINAGLYRRQSGVEWLVIKAPIRRNATWVGTDDHGLTLNFKIISLTAKVTVLAGTYENCLVVDVTSVVSGFPHRARIWYAPNVGIVKSVDYVAGVPVRNVQLKAYVLQ